MVATPIVLALDQGTSSTKALAFAVDGTLLRKAVVPVSIDTAQVGWMEQDPREILQSVFEAVSKVVLAHETVAAVGLSNQRESALLWETQSAKPLGPMLGWQDRRTSERAQDLTAHGVAGTVHEISGLPLDPMFSALKIEWLLNKFDPDRKLARNGQITVGTLDSWLVAALTGDRRIEVGNASRSQLFSITEATWSKELLEVFNVPDKALPIIVSSDDHTSVIRETGTVLDGARICSVLGDSHSALFAHGARVAGEVKTTLGTGSSVMGLVEQPVPMNSGLAYSVAWGVNGQIARAAEGNILSIGSTLLWAADLLGVSVADLDELAQSVPNSQGVALVPAFEGLGAPWWDSSAKAVLSGFGPGAGREALARAAFESIPLQIKDVLDRVAALGAGINQILVDGGPTTNRWLMQLQADITGRKIVRSDLAELSGTGVAHLAGISASIWDESLLDAVGRPRTIFEVGPQGSNAHEVHEKWQDALARARFRNAA